MKTGRRTVLAGMFGVVLAGVIPAMPAKSALPALLQLDFGGAATNPNAADGYTRVLPGSVYSATVGWGWFGTDVSGLQARDRSTPAPAPPLLRDFIFHTVARTFRLGKLTGGKRYRLTLLTGDRDFGNHTTKITITGLDGANGNLIVKPTTGQFATIIGTFVVPSGSTTIDIKFETTELNWVINALVLEDVTDAQPTRVTQSPASASTWGTVLTSADPTDPLLSGHRARLANNPSLPFQPTGLVNSDYLTLIASEIDFWKTQQRSTTGAIIDPYLNAEFQYSTPAFALAASTLVVYAGRTDLVEAAALALDWSAQTLSTHNAASHHEDFFAPMVAHSIRLLKPFVSPSRSAAWEYNIGIFEPFIAYNYFPGVNNWNVVAACGEALFQKMGLRDRNSTFVAESFARQGDNFDLTLGLYQELAMPYDHFPRLWIADLLARGYKESYWAELDETLRRGSISSLFLQSPTGELPSGGRSAHHQWNEASECVTFEIYAARALANGDSDLAAYFKRGAHLALQSMRRWVRASGEMQIIKNWFDPSQKFAYETYSAHSQYNLLPMAMLAMAYEHSAASEGIAELPAPADLGGFIFRFPKLNKVFANAGGAYVEIDTAGDHHYDATGTIRVHFSGHVAQASVSDSLLSAPSYVIPAGSPVPITTGIGVSWLGTDNIWRNQGELIASQITSVNVTASETTAASVKFSVTYNGNFGGGVTSIVDQYELKQNSFQLTTTLPGFTGMVRRVVPLLSDDGRVKCKILATGDAIKFAQPGTDWGGKFNYRMPGASTVTVPTTQYANHNGWARLATGEYAPGAGQTGVTLRIEAQPDPNAAVVPV